MRAPFFVFGNCEEPAFLSFLFFILILILLGKKTKASELMYAKFKGGCFLLF
jgi:hypothetical protein